MGESMQHKLSRTRKPRVHITYDVEIGDAIKMMELPFVVGVLSDLSGDPEEPLPKLKERKFVDISRDNFDEVLKKQKPRLAFKVSDKLSDDPDATLGVDISFESMKDFQPDRVVEKVKPLREMMEVRKRLQSLLAKAVSSDEVSEFLRDVITSEDKRNAVAKELGIDATGSGDGSGEGGEQS
jgi:type VI secretion system protein ImpB